MGRCRHLPVALAAGFCAADDHCVYVPQPAWKLRRCRILRTACTSRVETRSETFEYIALLVRPLLRCTPPPRLFYREETPGTEVGFWRLTCVPPRHCHLTYAPQ